MTHSHDHAAAESDSLRPKSARIDERPEALLMEAAASGRPDVLGKEGMLRMQRAVGNAGATAMMEEAPSVSDVTSRSGSPLPENTRAEMETRLGADFGDVRVHDDGAAHDSAQSVNAHAYTVGSNVVFQRGMYDTASHAGKTMLAHELTHVVQQRNGPVEGTDRGDGVKVSDPSDRFEQEAAANADRVMSDNHTAQLSAAGPAAAPAVQRHADHPGHVDGDESASGVQRVAVQREEPEDELQGAFVQREAEEEELQGAFVQREESPEEEMEG